MIAALQAADAPDPNAISAMEGLAQFGRGAVPFANQVRGAVDASAMKLGGAAEPWSELQDLYSADQEAEQASVYERNPALANTLEAAGGVTGLAIPGGGMLKAGDKAADAQRLAARLAKPRVKVPATASKQRVRVPAGCFQA